MVELMLRIDIRTRPDWIDLNRFVSKEVTVTPLPETRNKQPQQFIKRVTGRKRQNEPSMSSMSATQGTKAVPQE